MGEQGLDQEGPVAGRKGTEGETKAGREKDHEGTLAEGTADQVEKGQAERPKFGEGGRTGKRVKEGIEANIPGSGAVKGKVGL